MARKTIILKRNPDLLTVLSTGRGQAQLALTLFIPSVILKGIAWELNNEDDPLSLYHSFAYLLTLFSHILFGASTCLGIIYLLTKRDWIKRTLSTTKGQTFSDAVKSFSLQHTIQKILIDQQIGNPNLTQKTTLVPDVFVRANFKNETLTDGTVTIDLIPGATDDIVQLGNDISSALVSRWNRSIVADDFEINTEQTQVTYFLFDTQAQNRLIITKDSDVPVVNENTIQLMQGWTWQLAKEPHMNLMAETGFGKTYLANYIIYTAAKSSIMQIQRSQLI